MKVLWFSNTPAGYDRIINNGKSQKSITGTWMSAIAQAITAFDEKIKIAIAFNSASKSPKLAYKNLIYYPIFLKHKRNMITKLLFKARHKIIYNEYINEYLKIIEDFKPDLVHIFGSEGPFGLIARYTTLPVVLSIQGVLTVIEEKYFMGIPKRILYKTDGFFRKIKFSDYKSEYRIFQKKAAREREILKNIKYIIGRTDWDRRIASVLAPNAQYFYNDEVLREEFYLAEPAKLDLKEKITISTITGPAPYKGLETICKSAILLRNIGIDFVWHVGGVTIHDRLIKAIKRMFKNECPFDRLMFHGRLDAQEIINILSKTNIYVMPSHIENSPNNLSEAMLLGIPCIATSVGGVSSLLEDGKEGILIQDNDPWELSGAILEIIKNYDLAKEYGLNARKRVLKSYNKEKISDDLLNIYLKILKVREKN